LYVCGVISDFAAKRQFLVEMEKSAAILALYDVELALASILLCIGIAQLSTAGLLWSAPSVRPSVCPSQAGNK